MTLPTVTPEQIADAYKRAFKMFYNRPIVYWRRLRKMRNLGHLKDNIHAFFYIILRRKVSGRGFVQCEWITAKKEDFWTIALKDQVLGDRVIITNAVNRMALEPASAADGRSDNFSSRVVA